MYDEMCEVLVSWRQPWSNKPNQQRESVLCFSSAAQVLPGLFGMPKAECCWSPGRSSHLMHMTVVDQCIDEVLGFFYILFCHEKLAFIASRDSLLFNRLNYTMAFTCPKALYSLGILCLGRILLWQCKCWKNYHNFFQNSDSLLALENSSGFLEGCGSVSSSFLLTPSCPCCSPLDT